MNYGAGVKKTVLKITILILILASIFTAVYSARNRQNYNRKMCGKLISAIKNNDEEEIEKYMKIKFDINAGYKREGEDNPVFPLSVSLNYGRFGLAKRMVIKKGADLNSTNGGAANILIRCGEIRPNFSEIIDIYDFHMQHGYRPGEVSDLAPFGDYNIFKEYKDYMRLDHIFRIIDHVLQNGGTYNHSKIITCAARLKDTIALKQLIDHRKIEIKYDEDNDRMALLYAVKEKAYNTIGYLISKNFRLDITLDGKTALDIAKEMDDEISVRMLEIAEKSQTQNKRYLNRDEPEIFELLVKMYIEHNLDNRMGDNKKGIKYVFSQLSADDFKKDDFLLGSFWYTWRISPNIFGANIHNIDDQGYIENPENLRLTHYCQKQKHISLYKLVTDKYIPVYESEYDLKFDYDNPSEFIKNITEVPGIEHKGEGVVIYDLANLTKEFGDFSPKLISLKDDVYIFMFAEVYTEKDRNWVGDYVIFKKINGSVKIIGVVTCYV